MPELPEVENYKKILEEGIYDGVIRSLAVHHPKIVKNDIDFLQEKLIGNRFTKSQRIGKYLFLKLSSEGWLLLHFGMSGRPVFYQDEALRPKHSRLVIEFRSGLKFAFVCMRMFGKVEWLPSLKKYREKSQLGPDALSVKKEDFIQFISGKKSAIKSILLQQKGFSGIGNWIADEMLFQTKVNPLIKGNELSEEKLNLLFKKMKMILSTAIECQADFNQFPEDFMVIHRWGDKICPHCKRILSTIKIGGRSTYFCSEKQAQ